MLNNLDKMELAGKLGSFGRLNVSDSNVIQANRDLMASATSQLGRHRRIRHHSPFIALRTTMELIVGLGTFEQRTKYRILG